MQMLNQWKKWLFKKIPVHVRFPVLPSNVQIIFHSDGFIILEAGQAVTAKFYNYSWSSQSFNILIFNWSELLYASFPVTF